MSMDFSTSVRYPPAKDNATFEFTPDFNAPPPTSVIPSMGVPVTAADYCSFERYAGIPVNAVVPSQTAPLVPMPVLSDSMPVGFQDVLSGPILGAVGPINGEGWMLVPPMRSAAPPRLRERPIGCKTIFVGGLPKALVEDQERADTILKAIFIRFDGIREVRVNQRQFAHVRFFSEEATEAAVRFSGFRLVLDAIDDKEHTGRLHVDYACNREDLREWEAHIRALERERRLQERLNPSSPTPVTPFSDTEVSVLTEKIKDTETFEKASQVLFTWLDRGELNRRNSNSFYSLIQCANSHIRQLVTQKKTSEEELEIARANYERRMTVIIEQLGQIQNILQAASKQKCWDHFSKPQRKNLETWRKQCQTLLVREQNQHLEQRQEDEMDLSDSDMDTADNAQPSEPIPPVVTPITPVVESHMTLAPVETMDFADPALLAENARLKDQVTALQRQLIHVITGGSDEAAPGSKRPRSSSPHAADEAAAAAATSAAATVIEPVVKPAASETEVASLKQALQGTQRSLLAMQKELQQEKTLRKQLLAQVSNASGNYGKEVSALEIRTIGFTSAFLSVHPFGATLHAIVFFLNDAGFALTENDVTGLLCRTPGLFCVIDSPLGPRWALVTTDSEEKSVGHSAEEHTAVDAEREESPAAAEEDEEEEEMEMEEEEEDAEESAEGSTEKEEGTEGSTEKEERTEASTEKEEGTEASTEKEEGTEASTEKEESAEASTEKEKRTEASREEDEGTGASTEKEEGSEGSREEDEQVITEERQETDEALSQASDPPCEVVDSSPTDC